MEKNDCIFCKIAKEEIPSEKVYEDEDFFAFMDNKPLNPGHVLLIPKKHVKWVNDYEPFAKYWETARKLSRTIQKALNPIIVSYIVYGLGVSHAHIHLIPKFDGDQQIHGPDPEKIIEYKEGEMHEVAQKIIRAL